MKRLFVIIALALAVVALLNARTSTRAATGGNYTLEWSTIGAGGGAASGGSYSVVSSIGQPAAGTASGGSYTLVGGIVAEAPPAAVTPVEHAVYLPVIRK